MNLPNGQRWTILSPLLDELLDLPPPARAARLEALRAQETTLADELEELLDAADKAAAASFLAARVSRPVPGDEALVGTRIGAYVIEGPLGQGGAGSVWRARRADGRFDGEVAIKLLHLSLMGRAGAQRFEREGAILARLRHPHIAGLLDAGVLPSGQPYLVIELVEGQRIDEHCDQRRLNVEQRLALFDDVLSAVAHAHNHLVIHRDIKPGNILVTPDGRVKLLDFGIAKLMERDFGDETLTAQGQRSMTPGYAAPEQIRGEQVTTATDIYALGVLLHQLLSGRHPLDPQTGTLPTDWMRATVEHGPAPLSRAAAAGEDWAQGRAAACATPWPKLQRQLQGDLENIVALALRKRPSERYQTAAAFADDLRRHRASEPVSARPASLTYRFGKFARRHRAMLGAGLLLLISLGAGLTGTLMQARRAEQQAARAERERDHALRELAYTQSSGEFISFLLQEGDEKPFTAETLLARAETVIAQQFGTEPAQHAHLSLLVANLYGQAGLPAKSRPMLEQALQSAEKVHDAGLTAGIECQLAQDHASEGDFAQAQKLLEDALTRLQADLEREPSKRAICLQARSEVAFRQGDTKAALADAKASIEAMPPDQLGPTGRYGEMSVVLYATLASALNKAGQPAEAVKASRHAIDSLDAMGRGHTRQAIGLYNNLGVQLSRGGQTAEAEQAIQQALSISKGFGDVEPRLEGNYAIRLVDLGRGSEAVPLMQHAVQEIEARGDKRSAAVLMIQGAQAWCQSGDLAGCEQQLARTEAQLKANVPPGSPTFSGLAMSRAQLALRRGQTEAARDLLLQAVAGFDAAHDQSRMGIRALTLLARTQSQLGDLDKAQASADRAVTEARAALSGFGHSEWLGSALAARAMVQQARGEPQEALRTRQQALEELQATLNDAAPAIVELRQLMGR